MILKSAKLGCRFINQSYLTRLTFLRLDRNRKPHMESLWHPGYGKLNAYRNKNTTRKVLRHGQIIMSKNMLSAGSYHELCTRSKIPSLLLSSISTKNTSRYTPTTTLGSKARQTLKGSPSKNTYWPTREWQRPFETRYDLASLVANRWECTVILKELLIITPLVGLI